MVCGLSHPREKNRTHPRNSEEQCLRGTRRGNTMSRLVHGNISRSRSTTMSSPNWMRKMESGDPLNLLTDTKPITQKRTPSESQSVRPTGRTLCTAWREERCKGDCQEDRYGLLSLYRGPWVCRAKRSLWPWITGLEAQNVPFLMI